MRLLEDVGQGHLKLVEKYDEDIPRYAILSHTWGADGDEVTFRDIMEDTGRDKIGYEKIEFCKAQAACDGLRHFWVDTCCIDKSSSAELSEAINSMFRWYQNADKCYVYLPDVSTVEGTNVQLSPTAWEATFRDSRWFTRGWTLQELLAPASVEFFSREQDRLGSKASLEKIIHEVTDIAIEALHGSPLAGFTIEERLAWAKHRETKRQEDKAYSLLGILNIDMSARYGEGGDNAMQRLRRKIGKSLGSPVVATESEQMDAIDKSLTERPETPRKPSAVIPFSRDIDFVERGAILDHIHRTCTATGSRAALVGLGGVGKSQLAIEYAYRTRDRWPDTWVFWVHASNAARFEQSFRDISNCVKISGRQNPGANIFQLVYDWLLEGRNGKWVLILDNVDDAGFLVAANGTGRVDPAKSLGDKQSRPIISYLPQSPNGSILITTRSQNAALKLVEQRDIIKIEPMSKGDALALFERKLEGHVGASGDVAGLAAELEFMPLAIVQAAAYISQRAPRCSVRQYLEEFRESDRKRASLLDYEGGQLRRDQDAKNSVIATWQISFDHVRQIRPSAAHLLSLMSFFDRQGIPEILLRNRVEIGNLEEFQQKRKSRGADLLTRLFRKTRTRRDDHVKDIERIEHADGFDDDILALRDYSFISIDTNGTSFEMHSLVQLATRKWLEAYGQQEKWKKLFIRNLCLEFPVGEYENWTTCQALYPHARSAAAQEPEDQESLEIWAQLLYKAAWYAWRIGSSGEAEKLAQSSLQVWRRIYGQEHEKTVRSTTILSHAYKDSGQWEKSEVLDMQVMETRKKKLGADHPDTLTSMNNLALTYLDQGRWEAAEELFVQLMETSKKKLGADHLDTLTSMNNLASTYQDQGRWEAAEELFVQVMETRKKKLGADHPSTLSSMNNLASTYRNQGRWEAAEELSVQVMETSKKKLGADHPDTLSSMNNLALTYRNQGRWEAAEELFVQLMETRKKKLGADHPDTLTSMNNLASTYLDQGRWEAAEELFVQVMETRKKKLGADHPSTLTSMNNLASTYQNQGRWEAAEELSVQVMEMSKKKLGADHPDTLRSINNLASTYRNQGRWEAAEELSVQVMEMSKKRLGADHPETLNSMNNLAATYRNQGRWEAAEELFMQVMETSKKKLGADHPSTLTSMNNLAFIWKGQSRDLEAVNLMKECVQLLQRVLGANHPYFISSSDALAGWEAEQADVGTTARGQVSQT